MKKNYLKLSSIFTIAVLAMACSKEEPITSTPMVPETEGEFVRIFVSDQDAANYYVINPEKGTVETQAGQFANGSLYSSPSGRFVSVINTNDNLATFFDSGIEAHEDHAHVKGTPKWALTKANASRPVHFYGRGDNMLVFNDGEGTLSHFKESTLHNEASARVFSIGVAHHGAPALLNNGTIAVTEKDGSAAGTLPERVKIVDMSGNTIYPSTIQTGGIHGEASNGNVVLFGSTNGILEVSSVGEQSLITYPSSFGTNWLGSIYYGKESNAFFGFKSKYGLYKINHINNTLTTVEESDKLFSATFDWNGEDLIVVYTDGRVKVLDAASLAVKQEKNIGVTFPSAGSKGNPVVAASEKYLYLGDGINGKVKMYSKDKLELVKEISLPGKPSKIALMGSMSHGEGNH